MLFVLPANGVAKMVERGFEVGGTHIVEEIGVAAALPIDDCADASARSSQVGGFDFPFARASLANEEVAVFGGGVEFGVDGHVVTPVGWRCVSLAPLFYIPAI